MNMPVGWDGLTTIEHLWQADPNLQVVICSANLDHSWEHISERFGQSDRLLVLKKPFDSAEVLQLAVALIEKRRLTEAASLKQEELERTVAERTKHLHEAQRESEQLLAAINSLMVGTDREGIVRRWNESAVTTFGLDAKDVVGVALADLPINWESKDDIRSLCAHQSRASSTRIEAKFSDNDGTARIVGFSSYPVFDGDDFTGCLILGTDLTDNLLLEQQLQNAQKLESVGQLAAGVAHEINTPMQYVGDNLDYLSSKFQKLIRYLDKVDELVEAVKSENRHAEITDELKQLAKKVKLSKLHQQVPEALDDSIEGVQHVSRIVRAMKELSHPGCDEKAAVNINHALETTKTVSTNEWKYVAEMVMELDEDLRVVSGLQGELNQVFLNLIVNASHAISDMTDGGDKGRGKITLRTKQHDDFVQVEIEDTGGGIPESIREKVFDPFFTTKDVGKGTGQGLALAHTAIVQKHGGRISFEVEEGVGTKFIVQLPNDDNATPPVGEDSLRHTKTELE